VGPKVFGQVSIGKQARSESVKTKKRKSGTIGLNWHEGRPSLGFGTGRWFRLTGDVCKMACVACFREGGRTEIHLMRGNAGGSRLPDQSGQLTDPAPPKHRGEVPILPIGLLDLAEHANGDQR